MHPLEIHGTGGYLGNYFYPEREKEQLHIGDTQYFVWREDDDGLFHLSPEESQAMCYDKVVGFKKEIKKHARVKRRDVTKRSKRKY